MFALCVCMYIYIYLYVYIYIYTYIYTHTYIGIRTLQEPTQNKVVGLTFSASAQGFAPQPSGPGPAPPGGARYQKQASVRLVDRMVEVAAEATAKVKVN